MKRLVFKTVTGVKLYEDKNSFYSKNPDEIIQALKKDLNGDDPVAGILAAELLEDIYKKGFSRRRLNFFVSDSPNENVNITIFSTPKRALGLAIIKFKEWGYKGSPILVSSV